MNSTQNPPTTLDIHQVMRFLPHRYPFLLVDRVLHMETNQSIQALKNVTINEPFFSGHFPGRPVMPGVLMIEALAQTAAILSFYSASATPDPNTIYYFVGIDKARFKRPVEPGDQLTLEVELLRARVGIYKYAARALVAGEVAAEAELMSTAREITPA